MRLPRPPAPLALAAAACLSGPAAAQSIPTPAAPAASAAATALAPGAETVVVTGARGVRESTSTRLPLTLQETPQSLSVVERERIELQSMFSVDQVLRNTTGINVGFWDTQRPLYFARGFQITDFQVDGIPTYSGSTNQEYDTAFYERIEIVRGANGLLSGAGLPSATVNLVRKRAQRQFGASVTASAGSWAFGRAEADLNLPLAADGRVRSRFVAVAQDNESHLDRYRETKTAWMGVIEADLTPGTRLSLGYQAQDNDPQGSIWGTIPRFAADGSLARLPRSTSLSPSWTYWKRNTGTTSATLDQQLGDDWQLKLMLARTEGKVDSLRVYGSGYPDLANHGAGIRLLAGVGLGSDVRDNVDLSISGRFSLLGRRHDLVLGYSRNKLSAQTVVLSSVAGWSYTITDLDRWNGDAPRPSYAPTGASRNAVTDQTGTYATLRWRLGQDWSLITGARLSSWKTWTDNYGSTGAYTGSTGAYRVDDELTPYLGAVWELTPQWSLYASHTGIFRPQNYRDKDNVPLAPVDGSNTEAGAKALLLDGRLNLTLALFRTVQNNLGVRDASLPEGSLPDGGSAYVGVTGTRAQGLELDVAGVLAPGWTVNGGYTYTKTTRHATDLIYANLPDHYVQLNTSRRLDGAWSRLTLGGGLNWQSKVVGNNIPHPTLGTVTVTQAAYVLASVFAQWRFDERWSATLNVSNLFDKSYWSTLDYPNVGEPRRISASLRWRL